MYSCGLVSILYKVESDESDCFSFTPKNKPIESEILMPLSIDDNDALVNP